MKEMHEYHIIIPGEPVRVTEQQHRLGGRKANGQRIVYRDKRLEAAREELLEELKQYRDMDTLEGPIYLKVIYGFPTADPKKIGTWKITRPDTDNLQKMLKDCMTEAGYWKDDAQVVVEEVTKIWVKEESASTIITVMPLQKEWFKWNPTLSQ